MEKIDFTIVDGEKLIIRYKGVAVVVDLSKVDPAAPPGGIRGCGVAMLAKPL